MVMTLTYIFHSGFVLETERCILVFDYWMDPAGVMRRYEKSQKHTYVFASHFHEDHFSREVFDWKDRRHTYILSKDILKHRRAQREEADVWLVKAAGNQGPRGTWEDENIKVTATGSNDSGVSWVVEVEGKRIFHAGDLGNWYARFLSEKEVPATIVSSEFGVINPIAEEKRYLGELKDIQKIAKGFDIVMFPVDGRIGNGYTLGGRQFIERFDVGLFVPMHFAASGCESAWRMEPFCQERGIPFWSIREEGESVSLLDDTIIRRSTMADIPRMKEIFATARRFMVRTGNPNQWTNDYPSDQFLQEDILSGDSYVCISDKTIVATFLLRGGIAPTYGIIYNGRWPNEQPYATIHRIASNGTTRGILHKAMAFALQRYDNIRIDTHRDNIVMQNAARKEGFNYCGIIHCWNGDERLAYQYTRTASKSTTTGITFRQGTIADATFIAKGFHMAMLYDEAPMEQIEKFARHICVREDVLYSWRNTLIAMVDGQPAGMLTSYNGKYYREMRTRTMQLVKEHLGIEFPNMQDEAIPGEYYLDSLAVMPQYRGIGIGRSLLQKGIIEGKALGLKVTLAVDPVNDRAKRLYKSLGFMPDGTLFIFGHDYEKMAHQGGYDFLPEATDSLSI